jgi:hypothetical protein
MERGFPAIELLILRPVLRIGLLDDQLFSLELPHSAGVAELPLTVEWGLIRSAEHLLSVFSS